MSALLCKVSTLGVFNHGSIARTEEKLEPETVLAL
jgi:hypothetical protein